jgi:hypothetical protein
MIHVRIKTYSGMEVPIIARDVIWISSYSGGFLCRKSGVVVEIKVKLGCMKMSRNVKATEMI